jgi:ribosomal protein S18 acetylase RimI-like enzyme
MQAWTKTMAKAKKSIFDDCYGQRHFHLQVLATHPKWQRRGAGTSLCDWGMRLAKMTGMTISVFASPMGRELYRHLGFRDVSDVKVSVKGEQESINVLAMSYEPECKDTA